MYKLPEHLQAATRERLDYLLGYHEQLLLKYLGKVRQEAELDEAFYGETDRDQLRDSFISEIRKSDPEDVFQPYHLMRILSGIIEYEEQLEQLDKLIRSYQTYHEDESRVDIGK